MRLRRALSIATRVARLPIYSGLWAGDIAVRAAKNAARRADKERVLPVPVLESHDEASMERAMLQFRPFVMRASPDTWTVLDWLRPENIKAKWTGPLNVGVSDRGSFLAGRMSESLVWMTPREFVERVFEGRPTAGRLYLRSVDDWQDVKDDLRQTIGRFRLSQSNTVLFIGQEGNVTRLHFDAVHGLMRQVYGLKRVLLFAPSQAFNLYEEPFGLALRDRCSSLPEADCMQADRKKFKRVSKADRLETVLAPGDSLYIPPYWWHEANCMESGVSLVARYEAHPRNTLGVRWVGWTRILPTELQRLASRRRPASPPQYRSSELPERTEPPYQLDPA